ncbi:uncharacterized protein [Euphorbia lathyris]|uniref:uncharacterized protein isoform X2 n=1 Tax=Euphorbia lathyris TaxID=212925 RepID=UPI00331439D4
MYASCQKDKKDFWGFPNFINTTLRTQKYSWIFKNLGSSFHEMRNPLVEFSTVGSSQHKSFAVLLEQKWRGASTFNPFQLGVTRHKRSYSDPFQRKEAKNQPNSIFEACNHLKLKMGQLDDSVEAKQRQLPKPQLQESLKAEILELQDKLQGQFVVRHELEKAMSCRTLSYDTMNDDSVPKAAKELIKEIAVLELEVVYLERYLLSLYRKTFDQQVPSQPSIDERCQRNSSVQKGQLPEVNRQDSMKHEGNIVILSSQPKQCNETWGREENLLDSSIYRCSSSLCQRSAATSPMKSIVNAIDSYHSLPLSMLEQVRKEHSNSISLAEHLGTFISNPVLETPNLLSEEMIKCISAIYCELADPPLIDHDYPSSPASFSSSLNEFPTQGQTEMWSPQQGNFSSFNSSRDNPFHIEESKEFSGPYCTMAKVQTIRRDDQKLKDIHHMLKKFRSLVSDLEEVDPRKLKHEEKLAFWINVHNSLVMHAFLVYGIPQNNMKRTSLILKAAYNVGGHTVNIDMIQSSILRCRLSRPGQWLRILFPSKTKFKVGDPMKAYSIDHPEPRLYFALSAGSSSDPAVRAYTPKQVFEDLEAAKEEYIQSNIIVHKEKKLHLPKLVESFAKELDLCPAGLMDMIEDLLPSSMRNSILQFKQRKLSKSIEWIPHNFTFRYLLSKELA